MKLLLDMGASLRTADFLRQRGHDAVHLREQGLQRMTDEDITQKAQDERRVVITFDLDFSRIIALQRLSHPSVVVFRLEQFTTEDINRRLTDILLAHESELVSGAIIAVDSDRVRVRSLPLW